MMFARGLRVLGILLLMSLFGGAQTTAQDADREVVGHAFAIQGVCKVVQAAGTPVGDAEADLADAIEGGEDINGTPSVDIDINEPGTPADEADIGDTGTPVGNADIDDTGTPVSDINIIGPGTPVGGGEAAGSGTPFSDTDGAWFEDGVLDADDEGFLCQDVEGGGVFEIGIDQDADGILDENEVLGTDLNNDQTLTEDELNGVSPPPVTNQSGILGEDGVLNADDEGFLREDIDNDGTFEIGLDEDESGTLDADEVLGSDLNEDEALTEDELDT